MGHIGVKELHLAVTGVPSGNFSDSTCTVCARANITRTPFPHQSAHRATALLQRIHCDICGPLPPAYGGYKYYITFICCFSRYITVYLLKTRDQALQSFINFRTSAETFCNTKITILRVDNAPELTEGGLKQYCASAGISYEKTVPDSPQQNGVAERCNLTLARMTRALLIDADLIGSGLSQSKQQSTYTIIPPIPFFHHIQHLSNSGRNTNLIFPTCVFSEHTVPVGLYQIHSQNLPHMENQDASSVMPMMPKGILSGYQMHLDQAEQLKSAVTSSSTKTSPWRHRHPLIIPTSHRCGMTLYRPKTLCRRMCNSILLSYM